MEFESAAVDVAVGGALKATTINELKFRDTGGYSFTVQFVFD